MKMGIDVSGLPLVPITPEMMMEPSGVASAVAVSTWATDLQNALILAGGLCYFAYERRPRGSARKDLLEVRRSTVSNANMGVFAKEYICEGTLLGVFPGYFVNVEDALKSKESDAARASAKKYMWALSEEEVLDPTNSAGTLDLEINYAFGLFKVDTTLARINEPPPKGDVNVYTRSRGSFIEVIAERDIFSNEELFMDYGQAFDRSDYDKEQKAADAKNKLQRKLDEEEMLTLQPITYSDESDSFGGIDGGEKKKRPVVDQDTALPDGFLSKLAKQDSKLSKAGILTPEEGANIFAELGTRGLTASEEDRELIDSLKGKIKAGGSSSSNSGVSSSDRGAEMGMGKQQGKSFMDSLLGGPSPSSKAKTGGGGILTPDDALNMFGGSDKVVGGGGAGVGGGESDEDEDLMASLMSQIGKNGKDNMQDIPDLTDALGFGSATKKSASTSSGSSSSSSSSSGTPETRTLLSKEEAADLQKRIDDLSDEQLEAVFAKMRVALGEKAKQQLGSAIEEKKSTMGAKKMPRAEVADEAIRKKYNQELSAIEDELEKIYSDPLGVWQELMKNPDKYSNALENNEEEGDTGGALSNDKPLQ